MTTVIKVLDIQNAMLNVTTAGRRLPLARFHGKIEIIEKQKAKQELKQLNDKLENRVKKSKKLLPVLYRIYSVSHRTTAFRRSSFTDHPKILLFCP